MKVSKNPYPDDTLLPQDYEPNFDAWDFDLATFGETQVPERSILVRVRLGWLWGADRHEIALKWYKIEMLKSLLSKRFENGPIIEGTVLASNKLGTITNGVEIIREIIRRGMEHDGYSSQQKGPQPIKTVYGTWKMCARCAKKWKDDPSGSFIAGGKDYASCEPHAYGAHGCECEHACHMNEKPKNFTETIRRMEYGEKVKVSDKDLDQLTLKLSADHPLYNDFSFYEDEPGFYRVYFKNMGLKMSGLLTPVKKNPMGKFFTDEELHKIIQIIWDMPYEDRNSMPTPVVDFLKNNNRLPKTDKQRRFASCSNSNIRDLIRSIDNVI